MHTPMRILHDNLENVFDANPTQPTISKTALSEIDTSAISFDCFIAIYSCNLSSKQTIATIQTEAPSRVAVITQAESIVVVSDVQTLYLPPWLNSVTPKRKKQAISPDVFDFQKLKKSKPRVAKKAKIVSQVFVDSSKMKYAEIAEPLVDKPQEEMQVSDYRFTRVELGKQTHANMMQDAQSSVTVLAQSYNELLAKKEKLKEENEQLVSVIQKITQSSGTVGSLSSFAPEESVRQLEKIAQKAKAVDSWTAQLIAQGMPVVERTLKNLTNIKAVRFKMNQALEAFQQSLHALERDLKVWREMDQVKLETLCSHSIISKREQYVEFEELMTNKSLVIQDLTKDIQATLEMSADIERDIFTNFEQFSCQVLNQEGELRAADDIVSQITTDLHQQLDSDQFSMDTISKFVHHRMAFDKMQAAFEEHEEAVVRYYDVIIKTVAVARNTLGPDPEELQKVISKFLSFKAGNGTN